MATKIHAIAFDVIETIFSLEPLRSSLARFGLLGEKLELLYGWTVRDGIALSATGDFRPFKEVLSGHLGSMLKAHGQPDDDATIQTILQPMSTLPASSDLKPTLDLLRSRSAAAIALTNGSVSSTESLLQHAGVRDSFAAIVSIDDIGLWKPCRETYLKAAQVAGCEPAAMALVAAHGWDCQGAKRAGLAAGWVKRKEPNYPFFMTPIDVTGETLTDVCYRLMS